MHSRVKHPESFVQRADAVTWLRTLPDKSVQLVITDPPYESLEKHRAVGTTTRLKHSKSSSNEWFEIFPNSRFRELFVEVYRVLDRNGHFYIFCDAETAFVVKPLATECGFRFWKPLVWDKLSIGMGYHYRARYEFIMFFEKGKRKLNSFSVPDVLQVPRIHRGYPTEKPIRLSEIFVKQSSMEGEWVCDPFVGAGSVGMAAVANGRRFCGADKSSQAIAVTRQRLRNAGSENVARVPIGKKPIAIFER